MDLIFLPYAPTSLLFLCAYNCVSSCVDIYYKYGHKKFVYLCAILALFSRKVIAWRIGDKIDGQLASDTLIHTIINSTL